MRNYSADIKWKALEVSTLLVKIDEITKKQTIYDKLEFTSESQLRRAIGCGVDLGLFHRIGSSASVRYVSHRKYSKRLESKYNKDVIKAANKRLIIKRAKETKERQRLAKEANAEKRKLKTKEAKAERAAKRRREKNQRIKSEAKKEELRLAKVLADEMKLIEEEAYKEQAIRLEIESTPKRYKAKFIGHDTEQRTSHRRIGTFFWFKAEKNGGECIGVGQ